MTNLIPSLAQVIEEAGLTKKKLTLAILDPQSDKKHQRSQIILSDGKNFADWHVESLTDLFRGNHDPGEIPGEPIGKYYSFLYIIESALLHACKIIDEDPHDEECHEIYRTMYRRPDGKSRGFFHDVVWQAACLALGREEYSEHEHRALFQKLCRSTRMWKSHRTSQNYVALVRRYIG